MGEFPIVTTGKFAPDQRTRKRRLVYWPTRASLGFRLVQLCATGFLTAGSAGRAGLAVQAGPGWQGRQGWQCRQGRAGRAASQISYSRSIPTEGPLDGVP
jgi:hypothetical protein